MSARARALALVEDTKHTTDFREAQLLISQAQVYAAIGRADAAERQNQLLRDVVKSVAALTDKITAWLADDMERTAGGDRP